MSNMPWKDGWEAGIEAAAALVEERTDLDHKSLAAAIRSLWALPTYSIEGNKKESP